MQKCWWGKFSSEDLGPWPFIVRGVNTGSSWTTDSVLLRGFWCSSSHYVLVLWSVVPEKQLSILLKRIGPFSGSVGTMASYQSAVQRSHSVA